jgi:phospholipase C
MPKQERGLARARAVPYVLRADGEVDGHAGAVTIKFANAGTAAAVFQVRSGNDDAGPWTYTVGAHDDVADTWSFAATKQTEYDLTVYGPNGFLRGFEGSLGSGEAELALRTLYVPDRGDVVVEIENRGRRLEKVRVVDAYTREHASRFLDPGETYVYRASLEASFGWYDLTVTVDSDARFRRRLAGHLETGRDGVTDPAIGG